MSEEGRMGKEGSKEYLRGTKYIYLSPARNNSHLAWSLSSLDMAATDDRAAHPCCPIGFLKLARTAVMRVCVVSWASLGLPSNKEHAASRRWRW